MLEATPETETCFIAITENKITRKPLMAAVKETKEVAKLIEAQRFNEAMALRDTEFSDQYKSYAMSANTGFGGEVKAKENECCFDKCHRSRATLGDGLKCRKYPAGVGKWRLGGLASTLEKLDKDFLRLLAGKKSIPDAHIIRQDPRLPCSSEQNPEVPRAPFLMFEKCIEKGATPIRTA